ncbi:branched-chain amino acid ABC transporter permease [Methylocella sp. CPCC 101449]|uniref:branched-chain amino acid ABC transporter permease n=1 Tax=Methylocella sp. CPCC 101449 TaxID=2987531 RepID=UPI00288F71D0|nr:branched-chain amino acid ABC transporter permease [Methylocella sp. CPCC 101449]MDT2021312.1 branched-chain amino acid ABC transporter permease [Methylocella sp. CPCC 101449]
MALLIEQALNGVQLGFTLFLLAAGLTLIFGIMGVINLAHGSLFMIGAYAAALTAAKTGSFLIAFPVGLICAAIAGMVIEFLVVRRLYARDHLDQVLATFGLILFFNQMTIILFGRQPLFVEIPSWLEGSIPIVAGVQYPLYRFVIILVGLLTAVGLYFLIARTRIGMLIRAGATNRDMVRALGVDIKLLYTIVFGLGAMLAGLAGIMTGPISAVQVGMGEHVLILTFVVIIIGGVGSIKGAFAGALIVGVVDTMMRAFLPALMRHLMTSGSEADALAGGISAMGVYLLMAIVLLIKPKGLLPAHG